MIGHEVPQKGWKRIASHCKSEFLAATCIADYKDIDFNMFTNFSKKLLIMGKDEVKKV